MEELWKQYATTQLRTGLEFEQSHPEVTPKTKAEEVHDWEDWASVHYA